MADDKPTASIEDSDDSSAIKRSKRPPPTLDLAASEVPRADPADGAPPGEEPAAEPVRDPAPDIAPRARKPSLILIPALAGAAAAAFVLLLVSLAGWPVGAPAQKAIPPANVAALDDLAARVAKVEAKAAARPAAAPTPPSLAPRIDALDNAVAALRDDISANRTRSEQVSAAVDELKAAPREAAAPAPPSLAPRIDALEKAVAALRDDISANRTRSQQVSAAVDELKAALREAAAPAVDLSPITARLTQIEDSVRAQASAVEKISALARENARNSEDAPLRRAVAASWLTTQVQQGVPFGATLKAASSGADATQVKALEPFAGSGIPSVGSLCNELLGLLPKLAPARPASTAGTSFIDRLKAGAQRLVHVERTDAAAGDSSDATLARVTAAARRNDLAGAQREIATLPAPDRAILQPWIDRVAARDAALAASQKLASDATAALAKAAP